MFQFFVTPEQINEQAHEIFVTGSDQNHLQNVLRMKVGEELLVSNGVDGREFHCEVKSFEEEHVILTIRYIQESEVELPCKIYLFQGLPKGDKMELIIQKTTELGVFEIIPVATKRSIVKLDDKKAKSKVQRWQTIAESAAKQSKRSIVPNIGAVCSFKEALLRAKDMEVCLIPYELALDMAQTRMCLQEIQAGNEVAVFIGPEGGFSEEEIGLAMDSGFKPITLGRRILRTETAGLVTLSYLNFVLEGNPV